MAFATRSILIYALGGGLGHLTRALALARAIAGRAKVRILTNSRYAAMVSEGDLLTLDPRLSMDKARSAVLRAIDEAAPDCLVVDSFPRGLGGELAGSFCGTKVLIARDLNPRYATAYNISKFVESNYDLVLDCERVPWLVRDACEILARDEARRRLDLHSDAPCVLINGVGNPEECAWYDAVALGISGCEVRRIDYWPAMEYYAAADVVVGGAGYNTVNESVACGVPLVSRPWPRKYDRQESRAARATRIVHDVSEAIEATLEIAALRTSKNRTIQYVNGAARAADQLLHLVGVHP